MADEQQPIIKKVKKVAGHGHHGGAWKVAYADFVTAMMAFFLLLWLLNATTEEQKAGIANYFDPVSVSKNSSGSGGVMGGLTVAAPGSMTSQTSPMSPDRIEGVRATSPGNKNSENNIKVENKAEKHGDGAFDDKKKTPQEMSEEEKKKELERKELENFEKVKENLIESIKSTPDLQQLQENLLIDMTDRGLRIQIIDRSKTSMFDLGSPKMQAHTEKLMTKVTEAIIKLPNKIEVTGHTDSLPYTSRANYSNWDLSTERANESVRALERAGFPDEQVSLVSGKADKEPLIPEDPKAPMNRRIGIILLKKELELTATDTPQQLMADEMVN